MLYNEEGGKRCIAQLTTIWETRLYYKTSSYLFRFQLKGKLMHKCRRRYGAIHFLWDCFMVLITGGLWIIWIFIREMRNR